MGQLHPALRVLAVIAGTAMAIAPQAVAQEPDAAGGDASTVAPVSAVDSRPDERGDSDERAALQRARAVESRRAAVIRQVMGSVVAVCDAAREGGGSGVLVHPSGLALTNHHVILGAGAAGAGGLADGRLYEWELIATDPGGDLALVRLRGQREFPYVRFGDSDRVRVGDWALALGNPFSLADDYVPTVTLGIVSGVRRYQEGAGQNQLVYGNCIQTDTSINPGNSGGPLFDMSGALIGVNGRASFLERGRVNVGLGYAISINQARNFLGELMATRLVQHGTLDANFSDYRDRGVLCSTINELSAAAVAGLELGDQLLEFEGCPIGTANEFASLICTLPRDWPATLVVRKPSGEQKRLTVRLTALPYPPPPPDPPRPSEPPREAPGEGERPRTLPGEVPPPPQRPGSQSDAMAGLARILRTPPGAVRDPVLNAFCRDVLLRSVRRPAANGNSDFIRLEYVGKAAAEAGPELRLVVTLHRTGPGFTVERTGADAAGQWRLEDGSVSCLNGDESVPATATMTRQSPEVAIANGVLSVNREDGWFGMFGTASVDGSDKANGRAAIRLRQTDDSQDWYYTWLSTGLVDEGADGRSVLVKAAADVDCDGRGGGVVFEDWEPAGDWLVPRSCVEVRGLDEQPVRRWTLQFSDGQR